MSNAEKLEEVTIQQPRLTAEYIRILANEPPNYHLFATGNPKGDKIVGSSGHLRNAIELTRSAANHTNNVLILGETGTGKELIAQAIHYTGPRADSPFISENCAALQPSLLESELFGRTNHAFTGAIESEGIIQQAEEGTLFLDEIAELPIESQRKILRVIENRELRKLGENQSKPCNVRFVFATNKDLTKMVHAGKFLPELYYRISGYPISLPSLRNRKEDIPELLEYLIKRRLNKNGYENLSAVYVEKSELQLLERYNWPGNIRELDSMIERSMQKTRMNNQSRNFLILNNFRVCMDNENLGIPSKVESQPPSLLTLERTKDLYVLHAYATLQGNLARVAEVLGISLNSVKNYINRAIQSNNPPKEIDLTELVAGSIEKSQGFNKINRLDDEKIPVYAPRKIEQRIKKLFNEVVKRANSNPTLTTYEDSNSGIFSIKYVGEQIRESDIKLLGNYLRTIGGNLLLTSNKDDQTIQLSMPLVTQP